MYEITKIVFFKVYYDKFIHEQSLLEGYNILV